MNSKRVSEFQKKVIWYWQSEGRHSLPWRETEDPYKILVSEVMLQQTQVSRVIPKYETFLKKFPTAKALSKAPLSSVLKEWSGLGYNRRAKYLREAAKIISKKRKFPQTLEGLTSLPGVGDYTAKAVRVFAYDQPEVFIETNIRTAFLHDFFKKTKRVNDRVILSIAREAAEDQDPRQWHWALMDYGAHLKAEGVRLNQKSAHYAKQSKFHGSLREARGAIMRTLGFSVMNEETLEAELEFPRVRFHLALEGLFKDGLIEERDGMLRLALN